MEWWKPSSTRHLPVCERGCTRSADPALWKCELHRVPPVQGKWARQFHHLRVQGPVVDAGPQASILFTQEEAGCGWWGGELDESLLESLIDVLLHCLVLQDGQRIHSTLASEAGLIHLNGFWYWRTGSGWGWWVSGGWAPPAHPLESRPGDPSQPGECIRSGLLSAHRPERQGLVIKTAGSLTSWAVGSKATVQRWVTLEYKGFKAS